MNKRTPKTSELAALSSDFDASIAACLAGLQETGNPIYAWQAIGHCIVHEKKFPDWLMGYLAMCVTRMKSPEATKSRDLRKILPWVFGFPSLLDTGKRKRGRGNLLDPNAGGSPNLRFPLRFAVRLEYFGEDAPEAMRNAYNDIFDEDTASADDKTLRRWLKKDFGLKAWPRTAAEWKEITHRHYHAFGGKDLAYLDGKAASHLGISRDKNPFLSGNK